VNLNRRLFNLSWIGTLFARRAVSNTATCLPEKPSPPSRGRTVWVPTLGEWAEDRRRYPEQATLWFEDSEGRVIPHDIRDGFAPGAAAMCTRSVDLKETWHSRDGGPIASGESTWNSDDLVLAMALDGYTVHQAAIIVASLCERCLNAAHWDYQTGDGYPRFSEKWERCNTECKFCEDDPRPTWKRGSLAAAI
jgi:hypothetical protein